MLHGSLLNGMTQKALDAFGIPLGDTSLISWNNTMVFVSSLVDLSLVHSHFLLIVPLYVLLGDVLLFLAEQDVYTIQDQKYDWQAQSVYLSFLPLRSSRRLPSSFLSVFIPLSSCSSACPPPPIGTHANSKESTVHFFPSLNTAQAYKPVFLFLDILLLFLPVDLAFTGTITCRKSDARF